MLSKKILSVLALILLLFIICAGYVITGVQKNLAAMAEPAEEVTYFPSYPPVNTTGKNAELIQRGEYLAKAGDCIACHTNTFEKGKTFAGGLPMQTPFGVIYTPNITPDKSTGIGNWTDAQFIKAMRQGISPAGEHYYPAFPYLYFNQMTTEDLKALKAYLEAIPAITQKNKSNDMIWPFNWRFLQLGWKLLFFYPNKVDSYVPNPHYSAEWNRGAYLTNGLGHCAMCHTPSYYILTPNLPLGAPIRKYNLTGAKIQGYLAPNIMKKNIENVSNEELLQVFTHDRVIGGGKIEGPMLEVNKNSLSYLSREDLLSIITYLKTVDSELPPKPKAPKGAPGKPVYESYCSGCHATGAGGAPKYGDASAWGPLIKKGINTVYTNALKGIGGMPAKGTCLSCNDEEIKQAVDYMVASVTGKMARNSVPVQKRLTLEDGKHLYETNCSVCHAVGFKKAPKPGDIAAWKPMVKAGFLTTYRNVLEGKNAHPPRGGCSDCSDADIIAAVKYMMQVSAPDQNYSLW
ncbi:MAG: Gluconate 2-dehydrogenase cytochrome c subunit [Gammaproteobacteria bacterium]|jgi:cytochrome c5|nr:Gluconate 2-dehydrogenase cytochrome c subunit [Gammaproteobacteria bacterium]